MRHTVSGTALYTQCQGQHETQSIRDSMIDTHCQGQHDTQCQGQHDTHSVRDSMIDTHSVKDSMLHTMSGTA